MKKLVAVLLVMVMVLGMSGAAFAAPKAEKELKVHDVQSILVVQEFDVLYVGNEVELVASTPKHGSDYVVKWSVSDDDATVQEGETVLANINEVDTYVSSATFSAKEAGTYVVTYKMTMAAGKSHVRFVGEVESEEIIVIEEDELDEALTVLQVTFKNLTLTAEMNKHGKITGYKGTIDVYAQMSNETEVFVKKQNLSFSDNQLTRNVDVTVYGVKYTLFVSRSL